MKTTTVILALCMGMLLYRVSSDALTEGGKVDTARGLGRLVNRLVSFWKKPAEGFSPYYFPTTIDPKHAADTVTIPKSSRTVQELVSAPPMVTPATRVSASATLYPIFDSPEAQKLVPRAVDVALGAPL